MGHYAFMKAYFLKQASRSCGTKDEKGEAAYLFGLGFSSVGRYARMVPQLRARTTEVYK